MPSHTGTALVAENPVRENLIFQKVSNTGNNIFEKENRRYLKRDKMYSEKANNFRVRVKTHTGRAKEGLEMFGVMRD